MNESVFAVAMDQNRSPFHCEVQLRGAGFFSIMVVRILSQKKGGNVVNYGREDLTGLEFLIATSRN